MAEIENPRFYKGHQVGLKQFRLDLYRLSSHFLGDESLVTLGQPGSPPPNGLSSKCDHTGLVELRDEFFREEAGRILLQTASIVRAMLDGPEAAVGERTSKACGSLEEPKGVPKVLTLEDACNRLLHVRKINHDEAGRGAQRWHGPFLYLYGYRCRILWKARLNVLTFVGHAAQALRLPSLMHHMENLGAEEATSIVWRETDV